MGLLTVCKSILLIFIVYLSYILNISFVSYLIIDNFLISLILALILSELCFSGYKFFLSNDPGLLFFICSFGVLYLLCFNINFLNQNFLIFAGLLINSYLTSFLGLFGSYEDQLQLSLLSSTHIYKDFIVLTHQGIIFNTFYIYYTKPLGFISQADKRNFFELIKNNHGSIMFNDSASIKFVLSTSSLKFFSNAKKKLIRNIMDIDNMISNLLID